MANRTGVDKCPVVDQRPVENQRPVTAVIAAAGQGTRLGAAVPKAFVPVGGVSLLARSVQAMVDAQVVGQIVVIIDPAREALARELVAAEVNPGSVPISFVPGGGERADSVWAGLQTISRATTAPAAPGIVLVHDAARALTPPDLIRRVVAQVAAGSPGVVPVLPVADTIKTVVGDLVTGTPSRADLRAVQTPQGFDLHTLCVANGKYFAESPDFVATDDASLLEWLGVEVRTVPGDPLAMKITTPMDLWWAETLLAQQEPC